ncbi:MAG: hypothetical protein MR907_01645 [Firmicutes bacterium]|nr:hypothetical protein [Bacillota bacterium]
MQRDHKSRVLFAVSCIIGVLVTRKHFKLIAGCADSGTRIIPQTSILKLDGAGAGHIAVIELNIRQRQKIRALALIVIRCPVSDRRANPNRIGIVGIRGVFVILECAGIKCYLSCRQCAHNKTIECTIAKLYLTKHTPRRGIQLIVKAKNVIEGDAFKFHIRVGGKRKQKIRRGRNIVDIRITGSTAGDSTTDKNNLMAVGTVIALALITIFPVSVHFTMVRVLARGVVPDTIAQCKRGPVSITQLAHIHVKRTLVGFLRLFITFARQLIKLIQVIWVILCSLDLCLRRPADAAQAHRHDQGQNGC